MDTRNTLAELKKKWVWVALTLTIVLAAIIGPDDEPVVPPKSGKSSPTESKPDPKAKAPTAPIAPLAHLPQTWPERDPANTPIKDIFLSAAQIAAAKPKSAVDTKTSASEPTPQEQFGYELFGQLGDGPTPTAFLLTPDKRVITVEVGQNINPDWKLLALQANKMTLRHLPTGQTFQWHLPTLP